VIGWLVITIGAGAVCLLNVLGFTQGGRGRVVEHLVLEGSSWLAITLLAWTPWAVLRTTRAWSWPMRLGAHVAAALMFSVLHVGLFILFRAMAFAGLGQAYDLSAAVGGYRYEVWKDLVAYALLVGGYLLVDVLDRGGEPAPAAAQVFDIRDGARLVRVRLDDILAVTSAGNYVEFRLRDGRRPMMRGSLAALEAELGTADFLRTHRSWLVNARAVTGLTPEGSGDYSVSLDGMEAPLSRRYPEALKRLRMGAS
jgi:DNA-binding LytR/AlgR family response regulator